MNEKLPNLENVQVGGYRHAPYSCFRKMQGRERSDVTRLRSVINKYRARMENFLVELTNVEFFVDGSNEYRRT